MLTVGFANKRAWMFGKSAHAMDNLLWGCFVVVSLRNLATWNIGVFGLSTGNNKILDAWEECTCHGQFVVGLPCCSFSGKFCRLEHRGFWIVNWKKIGA